ncbi:MAG: TonB-dependent receptor domain-containing protein [Betaproteobacteria bacterium]
MRVASRVALGAQALLALALPDAHAQSTEARLPTAVVTPSRLVQSIDDALPSTTVITRTDIDRWQSTDLVGALSREAGVQFARSGGPGSASSLFLRGANSSQVLVLVDGVPLNAAVGGAASLGGIALDTVDRIEISRGNLSSLYGSAAIGGVVQIFTRGAGAAGASLVAEGGQGRNFNGVASASTELGGLRLGASVGTRRTDQFSAIDAARVVPGPFAPGANPDRDANESTSGSVGATYRTQGGTLFAANAWGSTNRTDFDSTADGPAATHEERSTITAWNARVRSPLTATWESQLQVGEMKDSSRNRSSEPWSFSNGEFESTNRQANWTNEVAVNDRVTAQLGVEHLQQRGASTAFDPSFANVLTEFRRNVTSAWGGVNGRADRQLVQVNVRVDSYSDVGSATTGLVSYGYKLTPEWRAIAQVSNAFRAPSFSDLYYPFFGNPGLEPEKSRSGELGLHYVAGRTTLRAALYRTDTRDLIVYEPATQRAENVDRARATGVEAGASGRAGPWEWSGNLNVVRAVNADTDERLLRRAPYVVNAGLAYDAGRWRAGVELSYVGPRDDLDINTFQRTELAAYTLARIVGTWRVTDAMALRARVENLTDEKYETVSGYNVQPRTAFVGVELRL